jgi:hypothetical protein
MRRVLPTAWRNVRGRRWTSGLNSAERRLGTSALTRTVVLAAVGVTFLGFVYAWLDWYGGPAVRLLIPLALAAILVCFSAFVRSPAVIWALIAVLTIGCLAAIAGVMWGLANDD